MANRKTDLQTLCDLHIKSRKTLLDHRRKLLEWNWLGFDLDSKIYFIRSYQRLNQDIQSSSQLSAFFYFENLQNFRIWCVGSIVSALIRWSKIKSRYSKKLERGYEGVNRTGPYPSIPLSNSIIANTLGTSSKQASIYKNAASKSGFIGVVQNQYRPVKLSPSDLNILRILDSDGFKNHQIRGANVFQRMPDRLYNGSIELKKSRKKGKHI